MRRSAVPTVPAAPAVDEEQIRWQVARATTALQRAQREGRSLAERRRRTTELTAALRAAVAAGGLSRRDEHATRTQLELHLLASLSTAGVVVPTVQRTTSLEGTGPHIAGMSMSPIPPYGDDPAYGMDLVAVLDGEQPVPTSRPLAEVRPLPDQRVDEAEMPRRVHAATA